MDAIVCVSIDVLFRVSFKVCEVNWVNWNEQSFLGEWARGMCCLRRVVHSGAVRGKC